jgi:hypothetical protein
MTASARRRGPPFPSCRRLSLLTVLAGFLLLLAAAGPARAQNLVDTVWRLRPMTQAALREEFRGMELVGMQLPPASDFDIPLADPAATVAKIKTAVDRVLQASPVAARGLGVLSKAGQIRIVYDAAFPERSLSRVIVAAFLVGEFQPQDGKRDFTMIVSRFGANWPVDELAAVLVHELIGHGLQRLKNRFGNDRPIDLECEARLWQQLYITDAGMPQDTQEMVAFRKTTDRRVCHDFRRYVRHLRPDVMQQWDSGRFRMADVIDLFDNYYTTIRNGRKKIEQKP